MKPRNRQYQVVDSLHGYLPASVEGEPMYFRSEQHAKFVCRELNGDDERNYPMQLLQFVVAPGPDHDNYHG